MGLKAKQIGWFVLVVLLVAALLLLTYWIIFLRHEPWWLAAAVDAGILALVIGFFAVRKYLVRHREKRFIDHIIHQDDARIAAAGISERHQILELQEQWKASIDHLRRSYLKKKGNPLYVLPWYMIIGESGAGKTSAVRQAGLNTPMTEVSSAPGVGATRNCDWWFFDKAVILDTAGRYTIPVDEGSDLDEWKNFLALLARYRKKEPLNGVIVAVAADRLLEENAKTIEDNGRNIRQRINQMMRTMGAKFPVYVLVTKMDRVFGFDGLNQMLDDNELDQAMGYINKGRKIFWKDIFHDALKSLEARLHRIRFQLLHRDRCVSDLLQFPSEFHVLSDGLKHFLESVFRENTYQETPLLRGVFFSSALRKGTPVSEFLKISKLDAGEDSSGVQDDRGIYLKDFFARILPTDRNIFTPLAEYSLWKRITSSLALTSWLLLGVLVSGILSYTWFFNRSLLDGVRKSYYNPPALTQDIQADLILLEKFREEIRDVESKNRSWLLPVMGFEQRTVIERELKEHYCTLIEKEFIQDIDKQMLELFKDTSLQLNRRSKASLFGYLVLRINALHDVLQGKARMDSREFAPLGAEVLRLRYPDIPEEIADMFGSIYYSYLDWNTDTPDEQQQLFVLQQALSRNLSLDGGTGLEWLVFLHALRSDNISMDDFWDFADFPVKKPEVLVNGAYTEKGRKKIHDFLTLLDKALTIKDGPDSLSADVLGDVRAMTADFWNWYKGRFYEEWRGSLEKVRSGTALLGSRSAWQQQAVTMVTADNPYFKALAHAADEINRYDVKGAVPLWAAHIVFVSRIRQLGVEKATSENNSIRGVLAKGVLKAEQLTEKSISGKDAKALADSLSKADAWNKYVTSLEAIPAASMSRKQLADSYAGCFDFEEGQTGGGESQSPFVTLRDDYSALQSKLMLSGQPDETPVLELIAGPLEYLLMYAGDETSCYLQQLWTESVLSGLDEHDRLKNAHLLFDSDQGKVWKFINGPAQPFLANSPNGYAPRPDFSGNRLSFSRDFLGFLDQGALVATDIKADYTVELSGLPVDVNAGAGERPETVRLKVNCSEKPFMLENFNYPVSGTITWSPQACGDTSLEIVFSDFVLNMKYAGKMGFARFLDEFRDGSYVFIPGDFPDKSVFLENSNVTAITVSYGIKGAEPVTRLLNAVPESVPQAIIRCWSNN